MNKPKARYSTERATKLKARLKDGYSEEDCIRAIDNCSRSKYHRGENKDKREYVDIGLIFRNGEKLEFFRDMRSQSWEDEIPQI